MSAVRPARGRPRRTEAIKRVKLRQSTFLLWNQRKEALGLKGVSNSEFVLLHQYSDGGDTCHSERDESLGLTPRQGRRELFLQSTPVNPVRGNRLPFSPLLEMSNSSKSIEVDITGVDTIEPETSGAFQNQTVAESLKTLNPLFSSLEGNPFADPEES